ncbi:MAG: sulfite exporter TauE/SafE family protein [Alphaproteobacteria bacterium]|nr:sulfite exporter TauE/SafE family protein [Alphaproteobacteria bacterium]
MDVAPILAVIAGTLVAGFASGLAGFAFVLVASGVFLQAIEPRTAVPVLVLLSLIGQVFNILQFVKLMRWQRLWPYLLGGALGVPLGVMLLQAVEPRPFKAAVGALMVAYAGWQLWARPAVVLGFGRWADGMVGIGGGVLGGFAGLSGALPTVWAGLQGWTKDQQRAVYQPFIVVIHMLCLAAFGGEGLLDREVGLLVLVGLPALAFGQVLGMRLYRRIDDQVFRRIVLWLLLASGLSLLAPLG